MAQIKTEEKERWWERGIENRKIAVVINVDAASLYLEKKSRQLTHLAVEAIDIINPFQPTKCRGNFTTAEDVAIAGVYIQM